MRYKINFMIAILIGIMFVTGCGLRNKANIPNPPKNEAVIQKGGQLVYGSLQEPNTLNPLMSDLLATSEVSSLIFSGLVLNNDKGGWIPDLAVDVPTLQNGGLSRDGLTVTYKLRQGVVWHDGAPFTAADVKFTWQTIMNGNMKVISRAGYDKIKAIDTPDPYTVIVEFKEHYAPYLSLFNCILPKHILEKVGDMNTAAFNRAPIGTGPFKFKAWNIAESIVLEANTSYFRGRPNLDTIIYKIIPDTNIMLTQLKSGEVDIFSNIPASQIEQVKAIDGVKTLMTPNMVWEHIDFNLDNPLFEDAKVRQAISLGIDRQSIINNVLKGAGAPAAGDQSPLSWSYDPTLTIPRRDVNAARELLTQAGWTIGPKGIFTKGGRDLAFSLTVPIGVKPRELAAQNIVQQLKEVGIEVELKPVEASEFFNNILKHRRFEAAMYAWVAGSEPDNYNLWNSQKIPSAGNNYEGQNYPGWRNPEVDALTVQGASLLDIEARKKVYFRIQELIAQECPVIPLYFRTNIDAVKTTVANYLPNPTSSGNLWNAWQWGFKTT